MKGPVARRWEAGEEHKPEVIDLIHAMRHIDTDNAAEYTLEMGGDGDEGETIAYLLDELIETGRFSITNHDRD